MSFWLIGLTSVGVTTNKKTSDGLYHNSETFIAQQCLIQFSSFANY